MNEQPQNASHIPLPSDAELESLFLIKYGDPHATGPGPAKRHKLGYYNPDDYYEALLARLVSPDTVWLDVGCGRNLFPSNRKLSDQLAQRCKVLVGADPDPTIHENPYVHVKHHGDLQSLEYPEKFNLVTMRMVAEHVEFPDGLVAEISRLAAVGARVVVYTVYKWSPVPIITNLVPYRLHHAPKRILWNAEEKDTFPTQYKMNTKADLLKPFAAHGFEEAAFFVLSDCRTFTGFDLAYLCELYLWKALSAVNVKYPERCLVGVYRKLT
jgi:SAM-dependent methyltransferase